MGKTLTSIILCYLKIRSVFTVPYTVKSIILAQKAFYFLATFRVFNFILNNLITVFYYSLSEVLVETEYVKEKRNVTVVLLRYVYFK